MKSIFLPIIDNGSRMCHVTWALSFAALMASKVLKGRDIMWEHISYSNAEGAMNLATRQFLASGYDTMLILDLDHIFSPEHVEMLLSHQEPFVGGVYAKKQLELVWVLSPIENGPKPFDGATEGLCEVAHTARGFLRLDQEVFHALLPHVGTYIDWETQKELPQFWKNLPGGHSEDFEFCEKWRAIGGKVFVDQRVIVKHEGIAVYPIKGTY